MRTARVLTNLRCDQRCSYCTSRADSDDLRAIQPAVLQRRIDELCRDGVAEIILTGGEPTLRRDLPELVAFARQRAARVVLETNATLIDATLAGALRDAGLTLALVNLAGFGDALDAVTRDAGGFARTRTGLHALLAAGLRVEIAATLVRSTRALLPELPAALVAELAGEPGWAGFGGLVLAVPVEAPDDEALPWDDVVAATLALEARCREVEVPLRFQPHASPPPCVFPERARVHHLYNLTGAPAPRPGYVKLDACRGCLVERACAGLAQAQLARDGTPAMRPVVEDRARRRLSLIGTVKQQMEREFITPSRWSSESGTVVEEEIIRVQFQCNQSCSFCFVSTHLPGMGDAAVRAAILRATSLHRRIVLSGGEPTLNPRLVEYVALAAAHSHLPIELQTNAVKLDDAGLVDALAQAGLARAFVSLHGATAAISDEVTQAPGTFARTVVGIDNIARSPLGLTLNFVLCVANYRELPAIVRLAATRWPRASVCVSFVAPSSDVVPRDRRLIPRYSDVMPFVVEAMAEARARGVTMQGFESMCGLPLCLVPEAFERFRHLAEIPDGFDRGEFVKPAPCGQCSLQTRCYGLRRGYAELYGSDELRPLVPSPSARSRA